MCADRALLSIGGIVNHLHNCDKIIYRPDSHNLLCRDFARDATPLVIIADEAPQVCLIICANWNFEREYFVPLDRLVFLVFRFTYWQGFASLARKRGFISIELAAMS